MHKFTKATDLIIDPANPFADDRLHREPLARNLVTLVGTLTQPVVLALDGPWGSGKTTFARMWRPLLEREGHAVVHFNAWDNDFAEDPLFAIMAAVETQLHPKTLEVGTTWTAAKQFAARFGRAVAPLALRLATRIVLGTGDVKDLIQLPDGADDDVSEWANAAAEQQIGRHVEASRTQEAFRSALAEFAGRLTQRIDGQTRSLVLIVDELDRCRPLFALQVLERIKHFFSVDRVVFVLVLDKAQLGHSIRAVYGTGLDADNYLRRFIDLTIELPDPAAADFLRHLYEYFSLREVQRIEESELLIGSMAALFDAFRLRIREQQQIVAELAVAARIVGSKGKGAIEMIAILLILRIVNKDLFHRYTRGFARGEEVLAYLAKIPAMKWMFMEHRIPLEAIFEGYSLVQDEADIAYRRTVDEYNSPNHSPELRDKARWKGQLIAKISTPRNQLNTIILPAITFASVVTTA